MMTYLLYSPGLMGNLFESDTGLTAGVTETDMSCLEFEF